MNTEVQIDDLLTELKIQLGEDQLALAAQRVQIRALQKAMNTPAETPKAAQEP